MDYLSTDKIIVVDLTSAQIDEYELEEDLVASKIGGVGITKHLYEQYSAEHPVVIGTGLLTGTMFPASAASVITAKSPVTGKVCHVPITLKAGIEIKYSGFDYIVLKGSSEKPVYLWVHDGVADIMDADAIWGKNVWETTDALRKEVGDDLLQTLVIGPAGETGSDFAQICVNHWNSADRFGFGKILGQKNLKGLAIRGMGLIEVEEPEGFVSRSFEILDEIKAGAWKGKKGIGEICTALGEEGIKDWLEPLVHRHSADYFTPYPSNTFVFINEDPNLLKETKVSEPGVLISDISALIAFNKAGCSATEAGRVLMACAKFGIDPLVVANWSQKSGKTLADDIESSMSDISGQTPDTSDVVFSPWCPMQPVFGNFATEDVKAWWMRRQAIAYIFGIQPLFALMSPEITDENLLELSNIGTGMELDAETLEQVVYDLCK